MVKLHKLNIKKKHIGKCFKAEKNYIVYKHVFGYPFNGIAILVIPKGTRIVCIDNYNKTNYFGNSLKNRKLRTELAYCVGIIPFQSGEYMLIENKQKYYSMKNVNFKYEVGKKLKPEQKFDDFVGDACLSGIHFFANLKDAEAYTKI